MSLVNANHTAAPRLVDPENELLSGVLQYLRHGDEDALVAELRRAWPPQRLAALLKGDHDDVVKVAAACLGFVGTTAQCAPLAATLRHDDSVVVAMAEHALRRIWFRQGSVDARRGLSQALRLIERDRHTQAVHLLDSVIDAAPQFAEAYSQRAIAHYQTGAYAESIADCERAVHLIPVHFAAEARMGHALVRLDRYRDAIEAYHRALHIHPRLAGIRQAIRRARAGWHATRGAVTG